MNEEFARLFGDPAHAVGRLLTTKRLQPARIVGVVRGMRDSGPLYRAAPQIYWPARSPQALVVVARTAGDAAPLLPAIRAAASSVDGRVPIFDVKSMRDRLDEVLARPRLYTTSVVFFGGLALLLSILGIYGVVSFACRERMREFGIRLALGTTSRRLRGVLLWKGAGLVAAGIAVGVLVAGAAGRYVATLIKGSDAGAPAASLAAGVITLFISVLAIWVATRRVSEIDIVEVLRSDGGG